VVEPSQVTPDCPHKSFEVSQNESSINESCQFARIACSLGSKAPICLIKSVHSKAKNETNQSKIKGKETNYLIFETADKTKQVSSSRRSIY